MRDRIQLYKFYLYFGYGITISVPIFSNWYDNNNYDIKTTNQKLQVKCFTLPINEYIKPYRNDVDYSYWKTEKYKIESDEVFKSEDFLSGGHAVVIVGYNDDIDFVIKPNLPARKLKYQVLLSLEILGVLTLATTDIFIFLMLDFPYLSDPNYFSYLDFTIIEKEQFRPISTLKMNHLLIDF